MYTVNCESFSAKQFFHDKILLSFIMLLLCLSMTGCNSSTLYEKKHDEMFSAYIDSLGHAPNHLDSLYIDMYVALRLSEEDSSARDTVIDCAEKLLKADTIASNRRHYLEAMQIVYSMNKDYDNYWKTSLRYFDTYPKESLERLSSLAMYYNMIGDKDSTDLYVDKTIRVAEKRLHSKNREERINGALIVCTMLIMRDNTSKAKDFVEKLIASDNDKEFTDALVDMTADFDSFTEQIKAKITMPYASI